MRRRHPNISLSIVGENRTYPLRDFEMVIHSLDLQDHVALIGYVDEKQLALMYRQADLFCFPSLYEGFGFPVLEAQRYGLPVVTLKNSSLSEIGGASVYYALSGSVTDLEKALEEMMTNQALREQMIQRVTFRKPRCIICLRSA